MLIDWFTVGAQALNFLILVWLMKHFLYKPILHAIDAREKKIAAELADADAKRAEARKDRDDFQHKNEAFDQQRAALLTKATDEAKAERQRLLDEARQAADALSAKRQAALRSDARNLNQAIARRTQDEVFAIARKALTELATTSLEERMGDVFTRRLRAMDGNGKGILGDALKKASEPAVVRSAFDLPAEERAKIQNAINETFSADIHLRFETAPDRISGIELAVNGQKVVWSIADYLASLEKGVGELLKQQDKPEPKPAPRPDAKAGPESETEAKPKADAESKAAMKPEAKVEPTAEPVASAKADAKAEAAKPTVAAAPKTKPEAKAGPTAETKAATAPAAESKTNPTTEAEPKAAPDPVAEAKPATKPEVKVEPATEPVAPAKAVPEVKTEPAKPEPAPKPEAKPPVETEAAATPATEARPKVEAEPKAAPEPNAKTKPAATPPEPKAAPAPAAELETAPKAAAEAKAAPVGP